MNGRTRMIGAALLGAAASTSSFAQGSITLYGDLDAALLYTSRSLDSATGGNAGRQFALTDTGMTPTNFGMIIIEKFLDDARLLVTINN